MGGRYKIAQLNLTKGNGVFLEVETLLGDPTKAREVLGWNPNETSFEDLVTLSFSCLYVQN